MLEILLIMSLMLLIFVLGLFCGLNVQLVYKNFYKRLEAELEPSTTVSTETVSTGVELPEEEVERHLEYNKRIEQIKKELVESEMQSNPPNFFDYNETEELMIRLGLSGMSATIITDMQEVDIERKAKMG